MPSTLSRTKLKHKWQFEAIGTQWSIETAQELGALQRDIASRIMQFDQTYSRFREDSLVTKLSQQKGEYVFPDDVQLLIEFYHELYKITNGAVSPLVGGTLEAAGYDRNYSLQPKHVIQAPAWDEVMQWQGTAVHMMTPALLDFGAAGKGYLVDIIGSILSDAGYASYAIDASGDVKVSGVDERIGLENPFDPSKIIGVADISNKSICGSASNRRAWGEWHHILDPRTARPVRTVIATWAIADTTMLADGLATALFFVSADQLNQWDFDYVRLHADGSIERSSNFVGELYT